MQTANSTLFDEFIASLPVERQAPMLQVWELVRAAMPAGYSELVGPKFLEYRAGTEMYLALASQKNYMSLYLMPLYVIPGLRERLVKAHPGLKLGKCCLNFKKVETLPLAELSQLIAATPPADFLALLQAGRATPHQKS